MSRVFIPHPIAWTLLAASVGVACGARTTGDIERRADRNVLLVTIDTLRSGALGHEGGPARTPNIDRLAAGGLRFSFAHAHAVITLPSHASILTGTYPFQHGYRENSGYRLAPGIQTMATRLKQAGFATGAFVAAFPLDARFGLTPGFDEYDGRFDDTEAGARFVIPERPAASVVGRATAWMGRQPSRWFAWVHLYEPHAPYRPPAPYDREYASQPYFGEVAAVDAALGPLIDALARAQRPTLLVLTSDHGESLGEHGEDTHGLFAYESTLHVPLIVAEIGGGVRAPGAFGSVARPGGLVATEPARHVDILPTVLDALELPMPSDLPGRSLRTASERQQSSAAVSYFEAMSGSLEYGWAPLMGVIAGRQKYIELPIPELYDLAKDAGERQNRADIDRDARRTLAGRLAQFRAPLPASPSPELAEVAARLRSLGYTSSTARPASTAPTERDDPKRLVALDQRMHEAAALDDQGRFAEAMTIYASIMSARPQMTAAARHLAFDQWRGGQMAAAIETLDRALAVTPLGVAGDGGLIVQFAGYLVETGQAARAIDLLERATAVEPGFDAFNALGLAYGRAGRVADARAAFDRALKIDPMSAMVYENLGAVDLDDGRLYEASRAFERAIALDATSPQAHNGLALAAARRGDRKSAIAHFARTLALQPDNFDALYDLGMTLAKDGQKNDARAALERFVRDAPPSRYAKEIANARGLLSRP